MGMTEWEKHFYLILSTAWLHITIHSIIIPVFYPILAFNIHYHSLDNKNMHKKESITHPLNTFYIYFIKYIYIFVLCIKRKDKNLLSLS